MGQKQSRSIAMGHARVLHPVFGCISSMYECLENLQMVGHLKSIAGLLFVGSLGSGGSHCILGLIDLGSVITGMQ